MEGIKSLLARHSPLADSSLQTQVLERRNGRPDFHEKLEVHGIKSLKSSELEVFQVNLGKMCNQTCKHCHVDAGPDRKEIMTRETMELVLEAVRHSNVRTVDLTGGAPEMNPNFRWFVESLSGLEVEIIVRCNLTIIVANPSYNDLPEFYKKHKITVISSLPHFSATRTDAQRGEGVFSRSVAALKMLNDVGYGKETTDLKLHLVFNPTGSFLPPNQSSLEKDFKLRLGQNFDIVFNDLYAITNMPISRFLDFLIQTGNYEAYMDKLVEAFNPATVNGLMCRNTLSVGWDGQLYDCDFNQMLEIPANPIAHISSFKEEQVIGRKISVGAHCFGCTAGAGSSCGGEIA